MPISVICVDDHPLMRKAIRLTVEESSLDLIIKGEGATELEAMDLIKRYLPDIALLDVSMRKGPTQTELADICKIIHFVKSHSKNTKIIIISAIDQPSLIQKILEGGANGYLLKIDNLSLNIPQAIQVTLLGGTFLSEGVPQLLINTTNDKFELTNQQQKILQTIFDNPDKSLEQIAENLFMSINTLRVHLARAREKLNAINTTAAVVKAIRAGLIAI